MVSEFEHPRADQVRTIPVPVKFWPTPGEDGHPTLLHGEHSRAILGDGLTVAAGNP